MGARRQWGTQNGLKGSRRSSPPAAQRRRQTHLRNVVPLMQCSTFVLCDKRKRSGCVSVYVCSLLEEGRLRAKAIKLANELQSKVCRCSLYHTTFLPRLRLGTLMVCVVCSSRASFSFSCCSWGASDAVLRAVSALPQGTYLQYLRCVILSSVPNGLDSCFFEASWMA